ncbi:MAG: aspartate carbamoyltransferase catalytic subunit [Alphaproteobacteria bacterium]
MTAVHSPFSRPHLLGIEDLTVAEIEDLLSHADEFQDVKTVPHHAGKTVVNLFFENSTRTRISFELAAKRLGAEVVNFDAATSSAKKGETLEDTARTINAMGVEAIVIRHSEAGAAGKIAGLVDCAVINGGDGTNEHPTQALLDAYTIRECKGRIEGLTIAICGDILHSRVAHSNISLFRKFGVKIRLIAPPNLLPSNAEALGAELFTDYAAGVADADVIMTQRIQLERMRESDKPDIEKYQQAYRLDRAKLVLAKPDVIVMNPGPITRNLELTDDIADDPKHSVILQQVRNGVAMRMAVLDRIMDAELLG